MSRPAKFAGLLTLALSSLLFGQSQAQVTARSSGNDTAVPFSAINSSLNSAADDALSMQRSTAPALHPLGYMLPASSATLPDPKNVPIDALIRSILLREGVPAELAAVVKVESSGNPFAQSPKGARGLWQLMPETARRYGLQVDSRLDERISVDKSTTVAARYLRDLYSQFGSWPMALAAYNTGEANLRRAIDRAQSNQFAVLSVLRVIPAETRNYVPAVLSNIKPAFTLQPFGSSDDLRKPLVYAERSPDLTRADGVKP